jgi:hypothetical protein
MGSSSVVVGLVPGQDRPQVPFAEDQHPVGDLGPGGEHESLGVGVGPRRQRRPVQMIGSGEPAPLSARGAQIPRLPATI